MRASGSTQRKVAVPGLRAEVAERRRRRSGLQSSAGSSRPSARSRGPSRSAPCGRSRAARRRDPGTGRSWPRRASPARAASGARSSRPKESRSASVPTIPPHGSPRSSADSPSGSTHRLAQVLLEGHAGVTRQLVREQVVAAVRVDPRAFGRREAVAVRPQAGRVREQVAERRALGPRRAVELDRPLLGRDEHGVGDEELADGGEVVLALDVACRPQRARRIGRAGGGVRHTPGLDLAQGIHRRRY